MIQSFRRIKIDPNDKLYSEIIRFGRDRCQRCSARKPLACCHIMGRAHMGTRWMIKPVKNALAMCADCHSWFDGCKDDTPLFDVEARKYFRPDKNAYVFLVEEYGYTWENIMTLYIHSHRTITKMTAFDKEEIKKQLKEYLENLKNEK